MAAGDEPFGTLAALVLRQMFAVDARAALVVAVHRLHVARTHVTLPWQTKHDRRHREPSSELLTIAADHVVELV